jgi:hypothetical protein
MHEAGKRFFVPSPVVFQPLDKGTRAVADTGDGHSDIFHTNYLLNNVANNVATDPIGSR